MSALEGLNLLDYTATGINKEDPVFQAIFSDHDGNGAIAQELDKLVEFITYYIRTDDVADHKNETLDQIVSMFTKLDRFIGETDAAYLRRMEALTQRKNDEIWGNKWDIQHVFETYFPGRNVYILENTDDKEADLIKNGDFEEVGEWDIDDAVIDGLSRFSKERGLHLDGEGSCAQDVELAAGNYAFHFFLQENCGVQATNDSGQYWNAKTLSWTSTVITNQYTSKSVITEDGSTEFIWENKGFILKVPADMIVTFKFIGSHGKAGHVDFVHLYQLHGYPSYTIIVQNEGYAMNKRTTHLAAGTTDPDESIKDYMKESYYENSFLVGSESSYAREIYQDILEIVRPKGIKAHVDFVERAVTQGGQVNG